MLIYYVGINLNTTFYVECLALVSMYILKDLRGLACKTNMTLHSNEISYHVLGLLHSVLQNKIRMFL